MSFRSYNTQGIKNWEIQVDGRGKRVAEKLENISESVSNCESPFYNSDSKKKELYIDTWYIMNTYQPIIPKDSQYVDMYEENSENFYYADEVVEILNDMEW